MALVCELHSPAPRGLSPMRLTAIPPERPPYGSLLSVIDEFSVCELVCRS